MNQIYNVRRQLMDNEAVSECDSCDLKQEDKPKTSSIAVMNNLGGRKVN
jgi:hypothetical protein